MGDNREKYRELCRNEPSIPLYSQAFWMDAVCGAGSWDALLYEKGYEIIGALPYYKKKKFGVDIISQPPFTQHNGVWMKECTSKAEIKRLSYENEIMKALIDQLEDLHVGYYQQCFSPAVTNWLPFYWNGYRQTTRYTYRIVDTRDIHRIFDNFETSKKKNILKVEKAQKYEFCLDMPAEEFYEFHKKTLEEQGKTICYGPELFANMYRAAYDNGAGRTFYLKTQSDEPVCALFNVWDSNTVYDLICVLGQRYRDSLDYLVYSVLMYSSGLAKSYDFEGSMIREVEHTFRYFGAVQTPYFQICKVMTGNPLLKAALRYRISGMI